MTLDTAIRHDIRARSRLPAEQTLRDRSAEYLASLIASLPHSCRFAAEELIERLAAEERQS